MSLRVAIVGCGKIADAHAAQIRRIPGCELVAVCDHAEHWVRRLPGGLLQNVISHGIARVAEFLQGEDPVVMAHAFTSRALAERAGEDVLDELRVMIIDEAKTTAYFTFSSRMRPVLHQFRIFGSRNGLALDET